MPDDERGLRGARGTAGARPTPQQRGTTDETGRHAGGTERRANEQLGGLTPGRRPGRTGPATLLPERAAELRALCCHPRHFATGRNAWNRLNDAEKWFVAGEMAARYDAEFSIAFVDFARRDQLIAGGATLVRGTPLERLPAPLLLTHGQGRTQPRLWRLARCPHIVFGACQTWIYPNGSELAICARRGEGREQTQREGPGLPPALRSPEVDAVLNRLLEAQQLAALGLLRDARELFEIALGAASRLAPPLQRALQPEIDAARQRLMEAGVVLGPE